jgi:hypothetical protein
MHNFTVTPELTARLLHNLTHTSSFIGAFAKVREATVSFLMSAHLSTWNNSAPTGWILMKFDILVFLKNLSRKSCCVKNGQE